MDVLTLIGAIGDLDEKKALAILKAHPALATAQAQIGATRETPNPYFFDKIRHYVYHGDTALHLAAAAHMLRVAKELVARGASPATVNRRGATPLHYAADGPADANDAQGAVVDYLISVGADPNALDKSGVGPLHRAVRNRCGSAVEALLRGGADRKAKTKAGSTALDLVAHTTGKSGSGTPEARAQQAIILRLLERRAIR